MSNISEMIESGIVLIEIHTKTQNECVPITNGNDPRIWKHLRYYSNHDWLCMILALEELQDIYPDTFDAGHITIFDKAKQILVDNITHTDKVMLLKENRSINWRAFMSMREVWNKIVGNNVVNVVQVNPLLDTLSHRMAV